MMPTSATGARPRPGGCAGFTLVELMVVVAIIGLVAGVAALAVPDPRLTVGAEAERFAARLVRAREEAILVNRPVGVAVTPAGYDFARFDDGRWRPLEDGPFGPETWAEGTRALLTADDGARIVFDPTGISAPAEVAISRDSRAATVRVDVAGEVRLDG